MDHPRKEMTFFQPETLKVTHKLVQIQVAVEKGNFIPDMENDPLTVALGNKEHPGRTRGIGLRCTGKRVLQRTKPCISLARDMRSRRNKRLTNSLWNFTHSRRK